MKKIYLSPERRPAPHGPDFGYPPLFEHDVTTSIAQKTAAALTRCGFSVKMAPPAATVRVRVAEAISWQADYYLPIHTNASSATPREGSARGPEVLAYGQPGGISWRACQMTYEELMAIYPAATTRGVRRIPPSTRSTAPPCFRSIRSLPSTIMAPMPSGWWKTRARLPKPCAVGFAAGLG